MNEQKRQALKNALDALKYAHVEFVGNSVRVTPRGGKPYLVDKRTAEYMYASRTILPKAER